MKKARSAITNLLSVIRKSRTRGRNVRGKWTIFVRKNRKDLINVNFRKKGIGQKIINYILNHQELEDVYKWLLITKDAHGVYNKVGFNPVVRALDLIEIRKSRLRR